MEHSSLLSLSLLLLVASAVAGELCNPDDKKVLLQIKESFDSPELLASWQSTTDSCTDWYQVQCDPTTNRIISLTIFDGELHGQIPHIVGDLPFLQVLEFCDLTSIIGPIPSTISKLTKLQQLRLAFLNLTGAIPPIFDNLKELNFLELSSNALTRSIPSSIGNLTKLNAVRLDHNFLTGRIPDSFGSFSGIIPQLFLSNNLLQGPILATLGSLNFSVIDFSSNQLTGDASFLFGKNKDLLMIDLSHNSFELDFTKVEFPLGLMNLDLNHNRIYGSLPESLTSLNPQLLNVSYNNLCGRIPVGGDLQSFDQSSYSNNRCLCGAPLVVACA